MASGGGIDVDDGTLQKRADDILCGSINIFGDLEE